MTPWALAVRFGHRRKKKEEEEEEDRNGIS
jgi:hypothetical protein